MALKPTTFTFVEGGSYPSAASLGHGGASGGGSDGGAAAPPQGSSGHFNPQFNFGVGVGF